jgi:hypothetical protein
MSMRGRRRAGLAALAAAAALAAPGLAFGHALILRPVSRTGANGITTGPCGVGRVGPVTVLKSGSTVAVRWRMDIPHPPQTFSISFSAAGDTGFKVLKAGIKAPPLGVPQTTRVTLPKTQTSQGTIQLVQHGTPADGASYFSCANVRLSSDVVPPALSVPRALTVPAAATDGLRAIVMRVTCSESCTLTSRVLLPRAQARRLGIAGRGASVAVGGAAATLAPHRATGVRLILRPAARAALARAGRATLSVRTLVKDTSGNPRVAITKVVVTR